MAKKRRVKVVRKRSRRAVGKNKRRRNRQRSIKLPIDSKIIAAKLPRDIVRVFGDVFDAPRHYPDLESTLYLAAKQATTDGFNVCVGTAYSKLLTKLAEAMRPRRVYVLGERLPSLEGKNMAIRPGPFEDSMAQVLEEQSAHCSFLYLPTDATEALRAADKRIVAGTTIVLGPHVILEFVDWAANNQREYYALTQTDDPITLVVVMAN